MSTSIIAVIGDKILFKRNNHSIIGAVVKVNEASVIVKIADSDAEKLKIETALTVVAHKNYEVIE